MNTDSHWSKQEACGIYICNCEFVTFPLVSWARCGTWLYRFLIFAPLLCFARATQVWLAVNHNTSITSGEWVWCSKRVARASKLGSCQSHLCSSWGYERAAKSKDSLKACFENIDIHEWMTLFWMICRDDCRDVINYSIGVEWMDNCPVMWVAESIMFKKATVIIKKHPCLCWWSHIS